MASNTLVAYYVIDGGNSSTEKSYMKIVSNYSISVSGSTATATVTSQMQVKRDSYGTTYVGPSYSASYESCYITINGTKKSVVSGWNENRAIGTSYVSIGNAVTHTVSYTASSAKTVSIGAGFDISGGSSKLQDLVIPVSSYSKGSAKVDSGSATLTFPVQMTDCSAPTSFSVSPTLFEGDVKLSWSGAKAGSANSITGYDLQYCTSSNSSSWGSWGTLASVATTAASGSYTYAPAPTRGYYEKYRVRTKGSAGSSGYSGWKESNAIRRNSIPTAPTSFSLSMASYNQGQTVKLSWSGATDKDSSIHHYVIQYAKKTQTGTWGSWAALATVSTTSGSGSYSFVPTQAGNHGSLKFRISTVDGLGAASGYKESAALNRDDDTGIHYWLNGILKKGYAYVCVNGTYKEGTLYVCKNGQYVKGID